MGVTVVTSGGNVDLTTRNGLGDGLIFVGNANNVATGVTMSGDATISNTGVVTVSNQLKSTDIDTLSELNTIVSDATLITDAASDGSQYARVDGGWAVVSSGGGDITKVGTPVNNQIGVWTGDGTLEGDTGLTFDGTTLTVGGAVVINSLTASGGLIQSDEINFGTGSFPGLRIGRSTTMHSNYNTIIGNNAIGQGSLDTVVGYASDGGSGNGGTVFGGNSQITSSKNGIILVGRNNVYAAAQGGIMMADNTTLPNTGGAKGNFVFSIGSTYANQAEIISIGDTQTWSNTSQAGVESDGGIAIGNEIQNEAARGTLLGHRVQNEGISNTVLGYGAKALRGTAGNVSHALVFGRGAYFKSEFVNQALILGGQDINDVYFANGWTHRYYDMDTTDVVLRVPTSEPIILHGMDAYDDIDGTADEADGGDIIIQGGLATKAGTSGDVILRVGDNSTASANTKQSTVDGVIISSGGNVSTPNGVFYPNSYTVATLPATTVGGLIYVSDETGGGTMALSDGTNWRRVQDYAVVS